ncbi:MAG: hypothetical protein R2697_00845 [Ilumatobacteraceae bacterium]
MVVGTSIGAVNGALVAADPSLDQVERMRDLWSSMSRADVFGGSIVSGIKTLAKSRTHVYGNERLRALLADALPVTLIEDLAVSFECVAASIEYARARYFDRGPIIDAVLASSAVRGCSRRSRSTVTTTSTVDWWRRSRSTERSLVAPTKSMCCRSDGSSSHSGHQTSRGRSPSSRSRSRAGTGSWKPSKRHPNTFAPTCSPPATRRTSTICASTATSATRAD